MNTQTKERKTVRVCGAKNGNAKLTARQVQQIRKLYGHDGNTCRSLAEKFGVGRQTVSNVVERVIWRGIAA